MYVPVPGISQRIPTLIVGKDEYDIRAFRGLMFASNITENNGTYSYTFCYVF
jgi:hypothetical protein